LAYKWNSSVLAIVSCVLLLSGCDESLPPRSDPTDILHASVAPPHEMIEMQDGVPIRDAGELIASLKNVYTEVLQKEANVEATLTIWMAKRSDVHRTIHLTVQNMAYPVVVRKMLTLVPKDSARFVVWWDQRTDEGVPFWHYVSLTPKTGLNGQSYQDSDPIEFVAQASIQVFQNVQPRTSPPIHYTSTYRLFASD
jgi:hypothetical protein